MISSTISRRLRLRRRTKAKAVEKTAATPPWETPRVFHYYAA